MGPVLHSLQTSTCPQAEDQTRDVCLLLQSPNLPLGSGTGQDATMVPDRINDHSNNLFLLPCSLQFCLSSLFTHISTFLSTTYLFILAGPGASGYMGVISGMLCSVCGHWLTGQCLTQPCGSDVWVRCTQRGHMFGVPNHHYSFS